LATNLSQKWTDPSQQFFPAILSNYTATHIACDNFDVPRKTVFETSTCFVVLQDAETASLQAWHALEWKML